MIDEDVKYSNRFYLYFHRNPNTNEIFYVGIGTGERYRKYGNRSEFWKRYVKKHGNPIREKYKEFLTWAEACYLESYFIKLFGRIVKDKNGILVNMSLGGDGRVGHSTVFTAEAKAKIGLGNKGKKVSEEAKKQMSESHFKIKVHAKKIVHNKSGVIYSSMTEAASSFGIDVKTLSARLRNQYKNNEFSYVSESDRDKKKVSKSDRNWSMSEDTKMKISLALKNNPKKCKKVLDTVTGEIFNSCTEAAIKTGVKQNHMSNLIGGKYKSKQIRYKYIIN